MSVGWQKGAASGLQKPHLLDNAGVAWTCCHCCVVFHRVLDFSFPEEDWLNELAMALKPNAEAEAKMTRTRQFALSFSAEGAHRGIGLLF